MRQTDCKKNTMEEIDYTVDELKKIIERLRGMSPLYEDFVKKQNQKSGLKIERKEIKRRNQICTVRK